MNTIKAIETRYRGYRFRSRTEARWAVFFDALGVKWVYEKEGYKLATGWYLPDFWLPHFHFFVEIKPAGDALQWEHAAGVMGSWNEEYGNNIPVLPVVLCVGDPGDYTAWDFAHYMSAGSDGGRFGQCPKCKTVNFVWDGWAGEIGCGCFASKESGINHASMLAAITAARSARFEHGENGAK